MSSKKPDPKLNPIAQAYQSKMRNPFYFWLGMLAKLPSAIFWRLRVKSLDSEKCIVTIPYFWRSKNPFKSIYFAALAGAGELSTGLLCQLAIAGKGSFSMLVVDFKAEFHKKANQKITLTCEQGSELFEMIDQLKVNDTNKLTTVSTGRNPNGDVVAKFYITWSFKRKA